MLGFDEQVRVSMIEPVDHSIRTERLLCSTLTLLTKSVGEKKSGVESTNAQRLSSPYPHLLLHDILMKLRLNRSLSVS